LNLCRWPELAAEVSLQPLRRFAFDGCIVFSDILLPLEDFGVKVDFPDEGGITVSAPEKFILKQTSTSNMTATTDAISLIKEKMKAEDLDAAMLGFAGAPWTLGNYILEGGSSKGREFTQAKSHIWSDEGYLRELLDSLTEMTIHYLQKQIESGAEMVQLFDSWAGELSYDDFACWVLPSLKKIFNNLPPETPKALFIKNAAPYLAMLAEVGCDVLSLDWKMDLTEVTQKLREYPDSKIKCLQGNLDPHYLTSDNIDFIKEQTSQLIQTGKDSSLGHILNLGHGITPKANLKAVETFIACAK